MKKIQIKKIPNFNLKENLNLEKKNLNFEIKNLNFEIKNLNF